MERLALGAVIAIGPVSSFIAALAMVLKIRPVRFVVPVALPTIGLAAVAPMLIVTRTGFPADSLAAFVDEECAPREIQAGLNRYEIDP
jgi:hypothetical protein